MSILFRQTLVTAVAFAFAVTAGQVRGENSFSMVVIDPGHGGPDPGGIPGQIVPEKTVALDTALRLQKLLQRAGLRTVMTRSTDIFVPLSVRSAIADAQRDAIFVSIHYNASPRSSAHGIETYSENNRGAVLAARIQQEIIDRVSTENRGIRSAEYYVLRKCRLPAVLVECGFLTNPTEAQLALTTTYREQIAEQIAAAIIEQRQFAFPSLAPTHRSGRLVHKNKKHRKIVDLERFSHPLPTIRIVRSSINTARALHAYRFGKDVVCSRRPPVLLPSLPAHRRQSRIAGDGSVLVAQT
jgi:N-acetylmuramoyl-L-alanine amidase